MAIARTFDDKRLKFYDAEDMKQLVNLMAQWRLLLGVTNESTDAELIFLCQFVYDEFGNFTLSDFKTAMGWAISRKIDIGFVSQKTFSAYYISSVMQAYEQRKKEIVNTIAQNKDSYLRRNSLENKIDITHEKEADIFKDFLIMVYDSYKTNNKFWDVQESVYQWMKATKQINATQEEVNEALVYGDKMVRRDAANGDDVLMVSIGRDRKKVDPEKARKRYAREYIVCKIFDKTPISVLLSRITIDYFKNGRK